ncbi:MAG: putative bifunctional diguanylate cyclase/phosphodiesterase [Thiohalomonadales bacterium]
MLKIFIKVIIFGVMILLSTFVSASKQSIELEVTEKAINNISRKQQLIVNSETKEIDTEKVDNTFVYLVISTLIILLGLFIFWIQRLFRELNLRKTKEYKLDESKKHYQALFDKSADALLIVNSDKILDCNLATLNMLGYETKEELFNIDSANLSPEFQLDGQLSEIKSKLMMENVIEKGNYRFEWEHIRKNGEIFPVEVLLTAIPLGDKQLIHVVWRDITERKKAAAEIEHQVYYDTLTKLPNRKLLLERLEQALITGRRHNHYGGLLFIDLDRFKSINDSLGHSIGDSLLIEAANRIKSCIWDEDTASRFGGDEYIVLLRHLGNDKNSASLTAKKIASRIQEVFKKPFVIKDNEMHVTSSIGIALFPFQEQGVEDIIKHADTAMYSAKENGRNQVAFYLSEMHEKVVKRITLEKDFRDAVNEKQLDVYYQPQIDNDNNIIAFEALARWKHPVHGFINPEVFIEIAEDTGLIYAVGDFILNKSISEITQLNIDYNKDFNLSVNISPHQFRKKTFVSIIKNLIDDFQLNKNFLTLEVTEHIAIENLKETIAKFEQLRQVGVRLSLDDFGTGYSSLSHLKRLPIDELKIDKSFIFDIEYNPQDALLVQTIIKIAHQFNLNVIAEGVETKQQLAFLLKENCNVYQGYYYSRPLPIKQLIKLVTA